MVIKIEKRIEGIKKIRILVVTHEVATRCAIINSLASLNTQYYYVKNETEGFGIISDVNFDLIITDSRLSDRDGINFCKALKNQKVTQSIPVIIIGDSQSVSAINQGFNAGASGYLGLRDIENQLFRIVTEELEKSDLHRQHYVLIVDDSKAIRNYVENGLVQSGFRILKAENGKKALNLMQKKRPDIILSDIVMPEMDGFAFISEVQAIPVFASIPFIVMSTKKDRAYIRRMVQAGAASYITKPFHLEQLILMVENTLSTQFRILLKDRERLSIEQKQMLISITSLVSALEARDPYTRGHSESVAKIISTITTYMGISPKQRERIVIAARLHDIGKIGIKDKVLLKPGPLTESEFEHIKQHPIIGVNIIKNIPNMEDIIPIIQFHHERFDGKGYPMGLKDKQIPLYANFLALADTYDSLTSNRPYRKKRPSEVALQIIQDNRGTQFNPECVDFFLKFMFMKEGKVFGEKEL